MRLLPPLLLLSLAACARGGEGDSGPADLDGDGWVDADCAPDDAAVHPGAPEQCNGADDNCDGDVDEGLATPAWYPDVDLDGWGDERAPRHGCAAAPGEVSRGRDCDDRNPDVRPDADEYCNGVDDDCDGAADDTPVDAVELWPDTDHDGYGDAEVTPVLGCLADPDSVPNGADCDDADAAVSPDAMEVCDPEDRDEDCDWLADDDDASASGREAWFPDADDDGQGDAEALPEYLCDGAEGYAPTNDDCDDADPQVFAQPWYPDTDGDGWGAGAAIVACPAPAGSVALAGDCDDADPAAHPYAPEPCDGALDLNCDGSAGAEDRDGDGDPACEDCDDADPARGASGVETCDGVDQDCDGVVDDGAADGAWAWDDLDGDGYGADGTEHVACAPEPDTAARGGDCDDADPAVSPAALEDCASPFDEDCDGAVDEDDASGCVESWPDADGDGWGSGEGRCACEPPAGAAPADGDCNDRDDAVSPGAPEGCLMDADENCDGTELCVAVELAVAMDGTTRWGMLGLTALEAGEDLDGDGVADLVVGAPGVDSRGAVYVAAGPVGADMGVGTTLLGGSEERAFGTSLVLRDVDGDGSLDLWVGDPSSRRGGESAGVVALFLGPPPDGTTGDDAARRWVGAGTDGLGARLAPGGDLDGDGVDDLLAGAPGRGAAGVVALLGAAGGTLDTVEAGVEGVEAWGQVGGTMVGDRDLDGDGVVDLLVLSGGGDAGTLVSVEPGPVVGWIAQDTMALTVGGDTCPDRWGQGAGALDDLDGDGLDDVWVGFEAEMDVYGSAAGLAGCPTGDVVIDPADPDDDLRAMTADLDGDGVLDLLLSDATTGGTSRNVRGWLGPLSGTITDTTGYGWWNAGLLRFGAQLSLAGDLDGDGGLDFVVSTAEGSAEASGRVYLVTTGSGTAW